MKQSALLCFLVLFFSYRFLSAQQPNKIRLVITDSNNNSVATIDTVLASGTDIELVLKSLGYDQNTIAKASVDGKRQITIATEEIMESPAVWKDRDGKPFGSTEKTVTLDLSPSITHENTLKPEDFVKIPAGAVVEELPDGTKRFTTTETDASGKTYTKRTTISPGKKEKLSDDGGYTRNWVNMEGQPIPPLAESLRWETESYSNSTGAYPTVQITLAECDMFDLSTLNARDKSLLNAGELKVEKLTVKPDYKEGYYKFSFTLPDAAPADLVIYDVVGSMLYSETVSGSYSKFIPEFNLYRKGTFLILLKQADKKFTQRLTID